MKPKWIIPSVNAQYCPSYRVKVHYSALFVNQMCNCLHQQYMLIRSPASDLLLSFSSVAFQTTPADSKTGNMALIHPAWSEVREWTLWQRSDVSCSLCTHRKEDMWVSVSLAVQKSSVPAADMAALSSAWRPRHVHTLWFNYFDWIHIVSGMAFDLRD